MDMEYTGCHQLNRVLTHNNNVVRSANPIIRVPLDASDCRRLDAHLAKNKLKKFNVLRAFEASVEERRKAAEEAEVGAVQVECSCLPIS
jgi:hypothetical protein